MRVLWFTNVTFPEAGPEFGGNETGSGGWMWGLADALRRHSAVSLGVVTACRDGSDRQVQIDGICHYRVAIPGSRFVRVTQLAPDKAFISRCREVVAAFKPDLIHIHGTEQTYGLLTAEQHLKQPAVVSLQGVLSGILPHYLGKLGLAELMRCHGVMNIVLRRGIFFDWMSLRKRCATERRCIEGNQHFMGRTLWDRAQLRRLNPQASYYPCSEVLRPVFYQEHAAVAKSAGPTVLATWGDGPLRGTHVLLKSLALVRKAVPDVELRLARGRFRRSRFFRGYWSHLDDLIRRLDIADAVVLLPALIAEEYAGEMSQARVFVLPSLVENSSNSLCEAMLLGTPCVASYVGGIPSLVADEETALCFLPGEHAVLAEQLIRLLSDEALASRISRNARQIARKRHDPQIIARRTVEIYEAVLAAKNCESVGCGTGTGKGGRCACLLDA